MKNFVEFYNDKLPEMEQETLSDIKGPVKVVITDYKTLDFGIKIVNTDGIEIKFKPVQGSIYELLLNAIYSIFGLLNVEYNVEQQVEDRRRYLTKESHPWHFEPEVKPWITNGNSGRF